MECGSWSDLEIRFQKDGTLEDAHPPFAEGTGSDGLA